MEKKCTEISMDEYDKIISSIDSMTSDKQLIEAHKKLIGKTCKDDCYEIKDCGVQYIYKFLSRDWGISLVYRYSNGAEKFLQSKYLSNYFKSSISELLSNESLSDEVKETLNNDKLFNDMSEEELSVICSAVQSFYKKTKQRPVNIAASIMLYLYKLDGEGVISFIKNNVDRRELASHILCTCGLNDRASYYSGRGVNRSDLSEKNLIAIFKKLLKLDKNYAIEFVKMIRQMKTLGATEFINSFMNFATNDFKSDDLKIEDSNISLDGLHDQARDNVAFASILSIMGRGNDTYYQTTASEEMKSSFMSSIAPILAEIDPEHMQVYCEFFDNKIKFVIKKNNTWVTYK